MTTTHPKIAPQHLTRRALVYVRQSTERQVKYNRESRELQYATEQQLKTFGWQRIEIIDDDLAFSASMGARRREGFERLLAAVALGDVGIVVSREVSRLSRTDKDWCRLLELCQIFDTLIGDTEQVYDLSLIDDQLILGIKGTLSVVELKVLRQRLLEGARNKARRGELYRTLAPGYVLDVDRHLVKDPNLRIREAIASIFTQFRGMGSIRQTLGWFHDNGVELPVNKPRIGGLTPVFQRPTMSFLGSVLSNPIYAGAYVYGRCPSTVAVVDGVLTRCQRGRIPLEETMVFLRDHHEGYIEWSTYEENQRMIRNNRRSFERDESAGPVRKGKGLLAGLLRCRCCGRKLHTRYVGKSGTSPRYLCDGSYHEGGRRCFGIGGHGVDPRFAEEILRVISPLGIEASLDAIEHLEHKQDARQAALLRQLQEASHDATRAFEQYDEVDARNRLVAAELERRYNEKLERVEATKRSLAEVDSKAPALTEDRKAELRKLGASFADVWHSAACPGEVKKRIVRTLVEEVLVEEATPGRLTFIVHWKGGCHTQSEMVKPRGAIDMRTSTESLELIRRLSVRYGDNLIASVLNKLGHKTGKGNRWTEQRVMDARSRNGIKGQRRTIQDPNILSLRATAAHCGVSNTAIQRLVKSGVLPSEQLAPCAPLEFRRVELESEPVKSILKNLRDTGKLTLDGYASTSQQILFQQ